MHRHSVPERKEELFASLPHGGAVAQAHESERNHVRHHDHVDGELKPRPRREDDHLCTGSDNSQGPVRLDVGGTRLSATSMTKGAVRALGNLASGRAGKSAAATAVSNGSSRKGFRQRG